MTISISRTGGDEAPVRRPAGGELLVPGAYVADRYRLLRQLVHRPYAQVWAVTDVFAGRDVEITVLVADDEIARRGFAERLRALAGVRDPAVVRIGEYGVGTVRNGGESGLAPYVITEPAPGVPLTEIPTGDGRLPIARILNLIGQAARGLDAVHRLGIVHGGVRRSSLFVARHHRLTIVDLPLGFDRGPRLHPVTDPGEAGAYLAPELWRPGQMPTPRGDVYALGVVAFECLAGWRPFTQNEAALLAAAPWGAQPPELPDTLAADIRWVVATAMQPEPRRRFTSAGQFADALEDLTRLADLDDNPTVILRRPALPPAPPSQGTRTQDARVREGHRQDAHPRIAHPRDGRVTDTALTHTPLTDEHPRSEHPAEDRRMQTRGPDTPGQDTYPEDSYLQHPSPQHPSPQDGVLHSRHVAARPLPWLSYRARRALHRLEPGDLASGALTVSAIGLVLAIGTLAVHDATEPRQTVNRMVLHLAGGHGAQRTAGASGTGVAGARATTETAGSAMAELVLVPDLTGRPLAAVLPILRDQLHLRIRLQWRPQIAGAPTAMVVAQSPLGTTVPQGTVITLTVLGTPGDRVFAASAGAVPPTAVLAPRPLSTTLPPTSPTAVTVRPTPYTDRATGPTTTPTASVTATLTSSAPATATLTATPTIPPTTTPAPTAAA